MNTKQVLVRITLNLSLIFISLVIGLLFSEWVVGWMFPPPTGYFVHVPYQYEVMTPGTEVMPGVEGDSRFMVNSRGVRGDELTSDHTYRIMAVGGSTTECLYLDQEESWPYLLQTYLNEKQVRENVWVGNIGRSGGCSREHWFQLEKTLADLPQIDLIVLLVGVNDFLLRCVYTADYRPDYENEEFYQKRLLEKSFTLHPLPENKLEPWYKQTDLWRVVSQTLKASQPEVVERLPHIVEDPIGEIYVQRREYRGNPSEIRESLPPLEDALGEYRRNLLKSIQEVHDAGKRLILVTQPVMWDENLPEDLKDLLWMGGVHNFSGESIPYYSIPALAEGMRKYNQVTREVARDMEIEIVDLASDFPQDTTVFYDDCHFNEGGARRVADALARYILQHPPFQKENN